MNDRPTELWRLALGPREITCVATLVPYGIEITIAHGGAAVVTRVFETGEEALAWAEKKRTEREAVGWTAPA